MRLTKIDIGATRDILPSTAGLLTLSLVSNFSPLHLHYHRNPLWYLHFELCDRKNVLYGTHANFSTVQDGYKDDIAT